MDAYKTLSTLFYDTDKPHAPKESFAFFSALLDQQRGDRPHADLVVYEPMCGSGRYLVPLARQDYTLVGSDLSQHMLKACSNKLASGVATNCTHKPELHHHGIQEGGYAECFDFCLIPEGSFCLLTDAHLVLSALATLYRGLKPGGLLALEIETYKPSPSQSYPWGGRWLDLPDGRRLIISWLSNWDEERRIMSSVHRYELIDRGELVQSEYEDFALRRYASEEFEQLLRQQGFVELRACAPYGLTAPRGAEETVIFLARRPG